MTTFSFNLLKTTENSLRLGRVTLRNSQSTMKTINTPNCILYTVRGSVPHLTPDLLRLLPYTAAQLSLEEFLDTQPPPSSLYPYGVHKFLNLEEYILFFDARDPGTLRPLATNTEKYVSVYTSQGSRKIAPESYIEYMNSYCPDILTSLADHVYENEKPSQKRVDKSVDRTLNWLDECLSKVKEGIHVFGMLVGHHLPAARSKSAEETIKRAVSGFALNGLGLGVTLRERLDLFKISLKCLPPNKPRLAHNIGTPEGILLGIAEGIDLFDTSYPSKMADDGHAITFSFGSYRPETNLEESLSRSINLWDENYVKDYRPFVSSCKCFSCQNHSRAYVHHLLVAREMLGSVLLICHNLFQYALFFDNIRENINQGTFEREAKRFIDTFGLLD